MSFAPSNECKYHGAMIFSLDVRRARKGDCLILHYGTKSKPGLVLIDGGPAQVYGPHLKPRLEEIRKARRLAESEPLTVDLIMVSHIDDDHINGILELTHELVDAKAARRPLPFKVLNLWHNTFDDIIASNPDELVASVKASFGPASLAGEPETDGLDPDTAKVLASVGQGLRLRDDARALGLGINSEFRGKLIKAPGHQPKDLPGGLKLTVAGPMEDELLALQKEHAAFLSQMKKNKEAVAAFTDASVANLSSIVVFAEAGGKKMLLTGDARGDKILLGLEKIGLLPPGGKMKVDVLKMPHHGSDRNMETTFLERVVADHYVFSGNGEHGNPERKTLQMLRDARKDENFLIHLTYPVEEIDAGRKEDWRKEQAKEKARKATNPSTQVRPNWSEKNNSLRAFFADHPELEQQVRFVEKSKPHVIDLLDKVGF
jgi:glyoxylase-like metal-dependent hydrolase (beta-lactamase superfamily II)